jgi:hypothetical protein
MEGEDSKVGVRPLWLVVSTKERGVRRMRIAHWQRALNGRVIALPTKSRLLCSHPSLSFEST